MQAVIEVVGRMTRLTIACVALPFAGATDAWSALRRHSDRSLGDVWCVEAIVRRGGAFPRLGVQRRRRPGSASGEQGGRGVAWPGERRGSLTGRCCGWRVAV